MNRAKALPLITQYIHSHDWRSYTQIRPKGAAATYVIEEPILDALADKIPDFLDRMGAVADTVQTLYAASPIELVKVPTTPTSVMGQLEFFLGGTLPTYVIYLDGEWYCAANEFFSFEG